MEKRKYKSAQRKKSWIAGGGIQKRISRIEIPNISTRFVALLSLLGSLHPISSARANAEQDAAVEAVHPWRILTAVQAQWLEGYGILPGMAFEGARALPDAEVSASVTMVTRFGFTEVMPGAKFTWYASPASEEESGNPASSSTPFWSVQAQAAPGGVLLPRGALQLEHGFQMSMRVAVQVALATQFFRDAFVGAPTLTGEWGLRPGWSVWARTALYYVLFHQDAQAEPGRAALAQLFPTAQLRLYRYFDGEWVGWVGGNLGQEGFVRLATLSTEIIDVKGLQCGVRFPLSGGRWKWGWIFDFQWRSPGAVARWATLGTDLSYVF